MYHLELWKIVMNVVYYFLTFLDKTTKKIMKYEH